MSYRNSGSSGPSGNPPRGSLGAGSFRSHDFSYERQQAPKYNPYDNQEEYDNYGESGSFGRPSVLPTPARGGYKVSGGKVTAFPGESRQGLHTERRFLANRDTQKLVRDEPYDVDFGRKDSHPRRVVSVQYGYPDEHEGREKWQSNQKPEFYPQQERSYEDRQVESTYFDDYDMEDSAYKAHRAGNLPKKPLMQERYHDQYAPRREEKIYPPVKSEPQPRQEMQSRKQEYFREPAVPVQSHRTQPGLLGEAPQPQPNILQQLAPQAQLALANTLISALVQGQQQQMAPPMMDYGHHPGGFGPGDYGRRDGRGFDNRPGNRGVRRDDRRGPPEKMQRTEGGRRDFGNGRKNTDTNRRERSADRKRKIPEKKVETRQKDDKKKDDNKSPRKGQRHPKNEEDKTAYKDIPKKYLFCHLCYKEMWNGPSFERHISGAVHKEIVLKTEESYAVRVEAMRLTSQLAEEKRELGDMRKGPAGHRHENYCAMCAASFSGSLMAHRKSKGHLDLKAFIHPHCHICEKDFHSRIERDEHFLSVEHMKKLWELEGEESKGKTVPEIDEGIDETYDPENPTEDDEVKPETVATDTKPVKEFKTAKDPHIKDRSVYFCSVCNVYLNHKEMAFDRHCRTLEHYRQYGYAIAVKNGVKKAEEPQAAEAEKEKGEDYASDDDGNWKRRGAKKHDETDYEESISQETDVSMAEAHTEEPTGEPIESDVKQEAPVEPTEETMDLSVDALQTEAITETVEKEPAVEPDFVPAEVKVEVDQDEPAPVKVAEQPEKEKKPAVEAKKPAPAPSKPEPVKKAETAPKAVVKKVVQPVKKEEPVKKPEVKKVVPATSKPAPASKKAAATPAATPATPSQPSKGNVATRGKNTAVRGRGRGRGS